MSSSSSSSSSSQSPASFSHMLSFRGLLEGFETLLPEEAAQRSAVHLLCRLPEWLSTNKVSLTSFTQVPSSWTSFSTMRTDAEAALLTYEDLLRKSWTDVLLHVATVEVMCDARFALSINSNYQFRAPFVLFAPAFDRLTS